MKMQMHFSWLEYVYVIYICVIQSLLGKFRSCHGRIEKVALNKYKPT